MVSKLSALKDNCFVSHNRINFVLDNIIDLPLALALCHILSLTAITAFKAPHKLSLINSRYSYLILHGK